MPMVTVSVRKSGFSSFFLFISAVCGGSSAYAIDLLSLPVACAPGTDCAIAVYFDADPTYEARDYLCGTMTYDGHTGVDFAAPDYAAMDAGIGVVAAAAGQVVGVRDGVPDGRGEVDEASVRSRECGNGVVIEHIDGLSTSYCHMRQGSITVLPGDNVDTGTPLGLIGQSGLANFPHLHFEVRLDSIPIDPFSGRQADGCGNAGIMSWLPETAAALPYFAGLPYHSGFAGEEPSPSAIRAGDFDRTVLTTDSPFIVMWTEIWGVAIGDELSMTIFAPDGTQLAQDRSEISRNESWWYRYTGRPAGEDRRWAPGNYTGEIAYTRAADGHVWTQTLTIQIAE